MLNTKDPLKRVRVATPCETSWDRMAGDERVRHCTLCELNVYNFAEMTRDEIRTLLLEKESRVCARLYRRADGTLLTRDCPSRMQALRQRTSRFASAVVAGVMFAFGCATSNRNDSRLTLGIEQAATQQQAMVTGIVLADDNVPLPGVTVIVRDEQLQREFSTYTDVDGSFAIRGLSDGTYRVDVRLDGFNPATVEHVALKQNDVAQTRTVLRFDSSALQGVITVGAIAPTETNPLSTTLSAEDLKYIPSGH